MIDLLTYENPENYFSSIAEKYLRNLGYEPVPCATEDEACSRVNELKAKLQKFTQTIADLKQKGEWTRSGRYTAIASFV